MANVYMKMGHGVKCCMGSVLAEDVPHPFGCNLLTNQMNPEAFQRIDGCGVYEERSWDSDGNNFEPDIDAGLAESLHKGNVELYEDDVSVILIKWENCIGYRYPKTDFKLLKTPEHDLSFLKNKYPKGIFDSIRG